MVLSLSIEIKGSKLYMMLYLSHICFKTFSQVLKSCRKKKERRKKGIEKTLYGEREIASKKPLLSPIPELPEVYEMSPSVPGVRRKFSGLFSSPSLLLFLFIFSPFPVHHVNCK